MSAQATGQLGGCDSCCGCALAVARGPCGNRRRAAPASATVALLLRCHPRQPARVVPCGQPEAVGSSLISLSGHGLLVRAQLFFVAPTGAQQLYYLHPDVSFFKGNGFKQIGPYLDMPDNSAAGDVSYPSALLVALYVPACANSL